MVTSKSDAALRPSTFCKFEREAGHAGISLIELVGFHRARRGSIVVGVSDSKTLHRDEEPLWADPGAATRVARQRDQGHGHDR